MNILDQLLAAVKDEEDAVLMYTSLSTELEERGLYRSAHQLTSVAADEKRHKEILLLIIEEVKAIAALVGTSQ